MCASTQPEYTAYVCMNPECDLHNQSNQGNIALHSKMGKDKHIKRLYCKACKKTFSENKGTLRENSKLTECVIILLLACFRWGVCDEGVADIAQVDLKTVRKFRQNTAEHLKLHHEACVNGVEAPAIQMDELRAKLGGFIAWIGVAMAIQSYLIVAMSVGSRTQNLADELFAQAKVRCRNVIMILTDGWSCYFSALMRCFGSCYTPEKGTGKGKKYAQRIAIDPLLRYGQVVKQMGKDFKLAAVKCKAYLGTMSQCVGFIQAYKLGSHIHTAHIERWFGNLRSCVAGLRRKSRCFGRSTQALSERTWIYISLHNWLIPHHSLSTRGKRCTPAMAAGLTDHVWTYQELIRFRKPLVIESREEIKRVLGNMQSDETMRAYKRTKKPKPEEEIRWKRPEAESAEKPAAA